MRSVKQHQFLVAPCARSYAPRTCCLCILPSLLVDCGLLRSACGAEEPDTRQTCWDGSCQEFRRDHARSLQVANTRQSRRPSSLRSILVGNPSSAALVYDRTPRRRSSRRSPALAFREPAGGLASVGWRTRLHTEDSGSVDHATAIPIARVGSPFHMSLNLRRSVKAQS